MKTLKLLPYIILSFLPLLIKAQCSVSISASPPTPVCAGTSVTFTANATGTPTSYQWYKTADIIAGATNSTYPTSTTGSYYVIVSATGGSCNSNTITINPSPDASITDADCYANGNTFLHCFGDCADGSKLVINNISTTTSTNTTYTIDWGDDTPNYGPSTTLPDGTSHDYGQEGLWNITVTVTNANGCTSIKKYVFFYGSSPTGGILSPGSTTGLCTDNGILTFPIFDGQPGQENSAGTTYTIDWGDGTSNTVFNEPPPANATHDYNIASCGSGTNNSYELTLIIRNPCGTTVSKVSPIEISDAPDPKFKMSLATDPYIIKDTFNENDIIRIDTTFTSCCIKNGNASNDVNLLYTINPPTGWSYQNGTGNMSNPVYIRFNMAGIYIITLNATSKWCSDCGTKSITKTVTILTSTTVKNNDFNFSVLLYPNPNNGSFIIEVNNTKEKTIVIDLKNNLGQLVYHKEYKNSNSKNSISNENIIPGIYLCRIRYGENLAYKKLIIF